VTNDARNEEHPADAIDPAVHVARIATQAPKGVRV